MSKALQGDGSNVPSPVRYDVDGGSVLLGSTAAHEPIEISESLWARRKSLEEIPNNPKLKGMTL